MKQKLHFFTYIGLVLCLFWAATLPGQSLLEIDAKLIEKTVKVDLSNAAYENVVVVNLRNRSPRSLQIRWERLDTQLPAGWKAQICDDYASYPPDVRTNYAPEIGLLTPVELGPGEDFDLYLHLLPYGISGEAIVDVPIKVLNEANVPEENVRFKINIQDNGQGDYQRARPKIYPNPVTDSFFINIDETAQRVQVYNTLGRPVKTFDNIVPGQAYDVSDLPTGIYLVSLLDMNGRRLHTLRMFRRNFRP